MNDIKTSISNLSLKSSDEIHKRVRSKLLKRMGASKEPTIMKQPNMWRATMKVRITKIVTSAAVLALIVVFIWPESSVSRKAYGISDVPAIINQAETLHTQGSRWIYTDNTDQEDFSIATVVPMERWFDLPNMMERFVSFSSYTNSKNERGLDRVEGVRKGDLAIDIDHTSKTIRYNKVSLVKRQLQMRRGIQQPHLKKLIQDIDASHEDYVNTGHENINGVTFDVWEREYISNTEDHTWIKTRCWLDPSSGKLGRYYTWSKTNRNKNWMPITFLEKIEYNIDIPLETFDLELPNDYKYQNTEDTAFVGEGLGSGWYTMNEALVCLAINFTLDDGSVIVAWHSNDMKEDRFQDQEHLYRDLIPGGGLPKLPMVIYGLKTVSLGPDPQEEVFYSGYHLGYTKKKRWFYEWAIYIPEQELPSQIDYGSYRMLCSFNLSREIEATTGNPIPENRIEEHEFDDFVRRAMAELDDEGIAPDYITYENVMQLVDEIKASLHNI